VTRSRRYCSETNCSKPVVAHGWCQKHWAQQKRSGYLGRKCKEPGCTGFDVANGLCDKHYQRARQNGQFSDTKCVVDKCGRPATWSSFCKKHGDRVRKYGLTLEQLVALDQGLPCAISGEVSNNLSVDHCETSNAVRGYITNKLNMGLGLFDHDPVLLRKAAAYLEEFVQRVASGNVSTIQRRSK
jgi:hypothetical protein